MSFTEVIQLQYSHEYDNCNSFKNRYKWTSAEMFLRRFSAAFRTVSIKNTHRWLLRKCSFAEYSQSIWKKPMWWSPFKLKLPENLKNSYFPKRTLRVSLPFDLRVTFIFPQKYRPVWISVGKIEIAYVSFLWDFKINYNMQT